MNIANPHLLRRAEPAAQSGPNALTVNATYTLSEDGRKAALLAGRDARAEQVVEVEVPVNRLHLVTVDLDGNARLKLRPRYDSRPDGRVVKIDAPPAFDRPPSTEDLFLVAARNHELERTYAGQRPQPGRASLERRKLRKELAAAFLTSSDQRAMVHPPPSAKRCYLMGPRGRVLFDAEHDEPPARDVTAEAHRRFRGDERARRERNLIEHTRRLAVHEVKKRFIADWIAANGTPDQRERHAAGLLPTDEAIDAMADEAFAPLCGWTPYRRDGANVLQAHLRELPSFADVVVKPTNVAISDADAAEATADQWARAQEARTLLPDATVTLRTHRLTLRGIPRSPAITLFGLLIVRNVGPFVLRREFAMSND